MINLKLCDTLLLASEQYIKIQNVTYKFNRQDLSIEYITI